jgi:hypothetical protein
MDSQRFDAIVRQLGASQSRRGTLRAALAAAFGLGTWLASSRDKAAARRNACRIRCGGTRRLCKAQCRTAPIPKQCKRTCRILRDQCFGRCKFKSPNRSQAKDKWSSIGGGKGKG